MSTVPRTLLTELEAAQQDPVLWPNFYRMLCSGTVYVPHVGSPVAATLPAELNVPEIAHPAGAHVPLFLEPARIAHVFGTGVAAIALPTQRALATFAGAPLVIEPGTEQCLVIPPERAQRLSDASYFRMRDARIMAPGEEEYLARPTELPDRLMETLERLFQRHKTVTRAYLMFAKTYDDFVYKHYVVGVEMGEGAHKLIGETQIVVEHLFEGRGFVRVFELGYGSKMHKTFCALGIPFYNALAERFRQS